MQFFGVFLALTLLLGRTTSKLTGEIEIVDASEKRQLQTTSTSLSILPPFEPLSCNANGYGSCEPFTEVFGTSTTFQDLVTIPCGSCVIIDHPSGTNLKFRAGLDVRGKLILPEPLDPEYQLRIRAPGIVIQGELEVLATKPVDGDFNYRFIMVDDEDFSFTAADNNAGVCSSGTCSGGKRSFTVAGGKLNFHGIPPSSPTFLKLYDYEADTRTLILPDSIVENWDAGAQIAITSHSTTWNAEQVRKIISLTPASKQGYSRAELNFGIQRPSTLKDDVGFAVEVALLSRNIVFDTPAVDGAHFIVRQTPNIEQMIEGIEIRNFGQAGILGRYPLHFHFCGDVSGSVVRKNTIRESRQRCMVVHGSDNLLLEDNVAYNNTGHCYMLEDGIETGNKFIRNIGIRIKRQKPELRINAPDGVETDDFPAVFWTSSPSNYWIDNVAAGSEDAGFWFELKKRGPWDNSDFNHLRPRIDPITKFSGNEFHSIGVTGMKYYLNGYMPQTPQIFENLQFNRNKFNALSIFFTRNIHCRNCTFQDNGRAVRSSRSEDIFISDSTIVGQSYGYQQIVAAGGFGNPKVACFGNRNRLHGVTMISTKPVFSRNIDEFPSNGVILNNVAFTGFSANSCGRTEAFGIESVAPGNYETFDTYSSLTNVTVDIGSEMVDFCDGAAIGIDDVYVTDVTGSLLGAGSEPQTILRNSELLSHFLDGSSTCVEDASRCLTTCDGVCYRSVHVYLDKATTKGHKLRICDKHDATFPCTDIEGAEVVFRAKSRYTLHLPSGRQYDAYFVDADETPVVLDDVDVFYRAPMCPLAPMDAEIVIRSDGRSTEFETIDPETGEPTPPPTLSSTPSAAPSSSSAPSSFPSASSAPSSSPSTSSAPSGSPSTTAPADPTATPTLSAAPSAEPSGSSEPSATPSSSSAPSSFPSASSAPSSSPSVSSAPSGTPSTTTPEDPTATPTLSAAPSSAPSVSSVPSVAPSSSSSPSASPSRSSAPSSSPSKTVTLEPTVSPIEIVEEPIDACSVLVETSDTANIQNWSSRGRSGRIVPIPNATGVIRWEYLRRHNRRHGPELRRIFFDTSFNRACIEPGSVWEIRAEVRLRVPSTQGETGGFCQITSTNQFQGCPAALVSFFSPTNFRREEIVYGYNENGSSPWKTNGEFNSFVGRVTAPTVSSSYPLRRIKFNFARFPRFNNVEIKDLQIVKVL